jgi:hypothetical protein
MKKLDKAQLQYDSMLPADPPPPHRYTGEVSGNGYVFTLQDGEFISVYDGEDTTPFWNWAGPNAAVEIADAQAQELYEHETL